MHNRYQIIALEKLWSEEEKFKRWLTIEALNCEALHNQKLISKTDLAIIKKHLKFDVKEIYEIEKQTKHDVIAFTRAVTAHIPIKARKWIHYGLTSTDVVDTANAMALKQTNTIILNSILELKKIIIKLSKQHQHTIMMGRTHGMHAEIITFGFKLIGWVDELNRQLTRFRLACSQIEVCKISGAVGTYANSQPQTEIFIAKKLGLLPCIHSTQIIARDNHAFYFQVLNNLGLSLNKFATELRHLHRSEVGEVSEFFDQHQKGSSAMPHKKNPIGLENICGLSRLLSGYALVACENVNLWHERDISHSSNERLLFIDAPSTLVYITQRFAKILSSLIINKQQMLNNVKSSEHQIFSGRILTHLIENSPLSREEIYDEIQRLLLNNPNQSLYELLKSHQWAKYFKDLKTMFDYTYYTRHIDDIFKRVLNNEK